MRTHSSPRERFEWKRQMKKSGVMFTFIRNRRYKNFPLCNKRRSMKGIEMEWHVEDSEKLFLCFHGVLGKCQNQWEIQCRQNVILKVPLIGLMYTSPFRLPIMFSDFSPIEELPPNLLLSFVKLNFRYKFPKHFSDNFVVEVILPGGNNKRYFAETYFVTRAAHLLTPKKYFFFLQV